MTGFAKRGLICTIINIRNANLNIQFVISQECME